MCTCTLPRAGWYRDPCDRPAISWRHLRQANEISKCFITSRKKQRTNSSGTDDLPPSSSHQDDQEQQASSEQVITVSESEDDSIPSDGKVSFFGCLTYLNLLLFSRYSDSRRCGSKQASRRRQECHQIKAERIGYEPTKKVVLQTRVLQFS